MMVLYWSSLIMCTVALSMLAHDVMLTYHYPNRNVMCVRKKIPTPSKPWTQLQSVVHKIALWIVTKITARRTRLIELHERYRWLVWSYRPLYFYISLKDIQNADAIIEHEVRLRMRNGSIANHQKAFQEMHNIYNKYAAYCQSNHIKSRDEYHVSHVESPSSIFITVGVNNEKKNYTYDEVMSMVAQYIANPNPWLFPTHLFEKEVLVDNVPGVYIIHNTTDDRYYVGQSVRLLQRLKHHLSGAGNNHIYADYKAGKQFKVRAIPLEGSEFSNLNDMERHYIKLYTANINGYNQTKGNRTKITV